MKNLHLTLYVLFVVTAAIVLLNRYTDFYINDYRVHFFFLFCAVSSFIVIVGHLFKKLSSNQSIIFVFIIVGVLCFLKAFFTWENDWKTQTVLYKNLEDKNKTVNFQMRGRRFSFGYKERVVCVDKLAPFMDWTTDIDTLHIDKSKWERIDLQLNELELPAQK
ncbi:hypothetical protein [Flavobacterium sp.]|uniref:hypothetical protein n=1 Tax=Flavobacterium sp. TaxID=239 RepID=UPI0026385664|nr:hypothetical protein [Flavobacterium sp.]